MSDSTIKVIFEHPDNWYEQIQELLKLADSSQKKTAIAVALTKSVDLFKSDVYSIEHLRAWTDAWRSYTFQIPEFEIANRFTAVALAIASGELPKRAKIRRLLSCERILFDEVWDNN